MYTQTRTLIIIHMHTNYDVSLGTQLMSQNPHPSLSVCGGEAQHIYNNYGNGIHIIHFTQVSDAQSVNVFCALCILS